MEYEWIVIIIMILMAVMLLTFVIGDNIASSIMRSKDNLDDRVYNIADNYGLENQKEKCKEELLELIEALDENDLDHITEEMGDVRIVIEQLEYFYNNKKDVRIVIDNKLNRQLYRMNRENENDNVDGNIK